MAVLPQDEIDRRWPATCRAWTRRATRSPARCRRRRSSRASRLVQHVAEAAEASDHHPDIDIRYTTLTFTLSTHSAGGVTAKDLDLAGRIDRLVADAFGD